MSRSLWVTNDGIVNYSIERISMDGLLISSIDKTPACGVVVDRASGLLFVNRSNDVSANISVMSLATGDELRTIFNHVAGEDMTHDGTHLVVINGAGNNNVSFVNPVTGVEDSFFTLPWAAVGLAWDGSGFWASQYTGASNALVRRFLVDGTPTSSSFNSGIFVMAHGLAYDDSDGTLWVGDYNKIHHMTTTGTLLSTFALDGRRADGLDLDPGETSPVYPQPKFIVPPGGPSSGDFFYVEGELRSEYAIWPVGVATERLT